MLNRYTKTLEVSGPVRITADLVENGIGEVQSCVYHVHDGDERAGSFDTRTDSTAYRHAKTLAGQRAIVHGRRSRVAQIAALLADVIPDDGERLRRAELIASVRPVVL